MVMRPKTDDRGECHLPCTDSYQLFVMGEACLAHTIIIEQITVPRRGVPKGRDAQKPMTGANAICPYLLS